jgi:hypothetical protein
MLLCLPKDGYRWLSMRKVQQIVQHVLQQQQFDDLPAQQSLSSLIMVA